MLGPGKPLSDKIVQQLVYEKEVIDTCPQFYELDLIQVLHISCILAKYEERAANCDFNWNPPFSKQFTMRTCNYW